jgi:hypothetical protein
MEWSQVGEWVKNNAGRGASLVGALMTGGTSAGIAAAISMIASATSQASPDAALQELQTNPESVIRLRELYFQNEANLRSHVLAMEELRLVDEQKSHEQTQLTIRNGDDAEDVVVKRTRPLQSSVSLLAAIAYVFINTNPSIEVLGLLLALPWAYAGLREVGKGLVTWKSQPAK